MPSNTTLDQGEVPASSSKTSLLWAYQLRREHVHLVDRIDDVNTQLQASINKVQTCEQNLSTLENLVKTLRADNSTLRHDVTLVRSHLSTRIEDISQQVNVVISDDKAAKDARQKLELEVKCMELQMSELSRIVTGLKEDVVNVARQKEANAAEQAVVEPTQDNVDLAKVESVPEPSQRHPSLIVVLRLGKKRVHPALPLKPAPLVTNVTNSTSSQPILSTPSTATNPLGNIDPKAQPSPRSYDHIFSQVHQNGRTISDYLAFTSSLRSQLPSRKQEGHIVEAFFDGITAWDIDGTTFKASLEDYLDKAGWIWKNLEVFCKPRTLQNKRRRAIYQTRARSRASALASQKEEGNL